MVWEHLPLLFLVGKCPMNQSETAPLVGTLRAVVTAGDEIFSVIVETRKAVTGERDLDQLIEGLVGERLRSLVGRPSEVVFVDKVEVVPAGEEITDRLEAPIEIPEWWPGAKVLSIHRIQQPA